MDLFYALFALATVVLPIGLFWALLAWNERKRPKPPWHAGYGGLPTGRQKN